MMDGGGASLRGCGDGDETALEKYEDLGNICCIRSGTETYVLHVGHLLLRPQWLHASNCWKQRSLINIRPNRLSESFCDSNLMQDFRFEEKKNLRRSHLNKGKGKKRDLCGGSNSLGDIFSQTFDCEAKDSSSGASCFLPPQWCRANGSSRALNRISVSASGSVGWERRGPELGRPSAAASSRGPRGNGRARRGQAV